MDTPIFSFFALAYLGLLLWGVALARRRGFVTPANLPLLVVAALVYDNLIIALGGAIGEGATLAGLNLARFWIHALITPLLVAWSLHAIRRSGVRMAQGRSYAVAAVLVTVALVVLELMLEVSDLRIVPAREYGALSYTNAEPPTGPPAMVLVVAAFLLVAGVVVLVRQRWPWLLVGAGIMTVGSAIDLPLPSNAVTNAFELILLVSIVATKAFQDAREEEAREPTATLGARRG